MSWSTSEDLSFGGYAAVNQELLVDKRVEKEKCSGACDATPARHRVIKIIDYVTASFFSELTMHL